MASCAYNVDHDTGAYHCEQGCDMDSICAHFQCSHDELCHCNGGAVPDCSPGCVVYLPERCWKTDYNKTQFHHSEENTDFSSEQCAADQHTGGGSCDPCDPCSGGGYGSSDANNSHNKVQYHHSAENTDYSSEQAHAEEHTGGQAVQTGGHSHGGAYGGSSMGGGY